MVGEQVQKVSKQCSPYK